MHHPANGLSLDTPVVPDVETHGTAEIGKKRPCREVEQRIVQGTCPGKFRGLKADYIALRRQPQARIVELCRGNCKISGKEGQGNDK